jgi:hypothetical protein
MSQNHTASKYSLKTRFTYSPNYHRWRQSVRSHGADSKEAIYDACQHAKQFNVRNQRCGEYADGKWVFFNA